MIPRLLSTSLLAAIFLVSSPAVAKMCGDKPNLLIVLDKSGSMYGSKWSSAKNAINNLVASNSGKMRFGLLLYDGGCTPPVNVPIGDNTHAAIMAKLNTTSPGGGTSTGGAIQEARSYLKGTLQGKPKYVLVITDGCSTSGCGNAVTAVQGLKADGVDTYVVGFGSGVCPTELSQMAVAGGTGHYYQASNPASLNAALSSIATQVNCCGNGVVDSGERCDTKLPGSCPSSCNDHNPCTTDRLSGQLCMVQCVYTPVTAPHNGDGCCPPGANSLTDSDCHVVCGNGLLEPGELCDPGIKSGPGRCPTPATCNDQDPCTDDQILLAACQTRCKHVPLTASMKQSDGCCPKGATSLTDKDCASACGNGLLEPPAETCDPGIKSGKGKCPTPADCDDHNTCTVDTLGGGACTLKCAHASVIPNASKKDGCCPKGANAKTDRDCSPRCGNGVLEGSEICDPGITSGAGRCPKKSDCDDGDKCTLDTLSGAACHVKCRFTSVGVSGKTKDGCCPKGHSSKTDADCLPPCGPDKRTGCVDLCKGVTCPAGRYCKSGKCIPLGGTGDGGVVPPLGDGGKKVPPGQEAGASNNNGTHGLNGDSGGTHNGNQNNDFGAGFAEVDGCACHTAGSARGLPPLLLVGLLLLLVRRRRR